jgi:hypothetical protein
MSTPKTPMEIEAKILGIIDDEYGHIRRPGVSAVKRAIALAYLQGDADRERLMREEASRGFEEWFAETFAPPETQKQKETYYQLAETWTAARADRAELVACVLEMASWIQDFTGSRLEDLERTKYHANLIAKLKAEKDAV